MNDGKRSILLTVLWGFVVLKLLGVLEAQPERIPIKPKPEEIVSGAFSDVRIQLPRDIHDLAVSFIKTGKIDSGRIGVDMTRVERIECEPGTLRFSPPVVVRYDGPGMLNAETTVREITVDAKGEIFVDVVNSPIDLVIEGED